MVLSEVLENAGQLARLLNEHKRHAKLWRFAHDGIENASVLLTSMERVAFCCAVSWAFSVGPSHSGTKNAVTPVSVYVGYWGVSDH